MALPGKGEILAVKPTAEVQLQFLQHLQRLFEDGDFVATYKYALLMSLAELAVEHGDDGGELMLPMPAIAEKFAELYWAQTAPYATGSPGTKPIVLSQNQGKQAAVVNGLLRLRQAGAQTVGDAKRLPEWRDVVRDIARTVAGMPIQYLQNVGGGQRPFLYDYPLPRRGAVTLKPGVAFMLRAFHPLIQQLARAGWVEHVRRNQRNQAAIGQIDDLEQFMFGTSRATLASVVPVLAKLQSRKCFYCGEALRGAADVDHFIPWVKYPRDLAHNFVLAHAECNRRKSDMRAAERHLVHWVDRNAEYGSDIADEMKGFAADVGCSHRVAHWAYEQALTSGGYGWLEGRRAEPLGAGCLSVLA